ncbi:glycosyltransferase [Citreimonas sp.]|uniref:glycosyltransferase n=1 Tax=Citreimonas sp. TaxID=3036715 RepID=UPI0035C842F3
MSWHFVIPPAFAEEVAALPDRVLGQDYPYWLGGRFNWVAQSYLVLRQYREGLTLGMAPEPDRINFAHCMGWRAMGARRGEFRISVRADYPRLFDVDFEILQNPAVPLGPRQAYLPYWPVPGVIPRDPSRQGLKVLAYAGRIGPLNLADDLKGGPTGLPRGLEFRIIPPHLWHDLSQIDALIAIRTFDGAPHDAKPPSKLFSAWRAGIPLIAGGDSAFSAVGTPGHDYLRVRTREEFTDALQRLHDDPDFYARIADNGHARADEVSHEAFARDWIAVFDDRIAPRFEAWKQDRLKGLYALAARGADRGRDTASGLKSRLRSLSRRPT